MVAADFPHINATSGNAPPNRVWIIQAAGRLFLYPEERHLAVIGLNVISRGSPGASLAYVAQSSWQHLQFEPLLQSHENEAALLHDEGQSLFQRKLRKIAH